MAEILDFEVSEAFPALKILDSQEEYEAGSLKIFFFSNSQLGFLGFETGGRVVSLKLKKPFKACIHYGFSTSSFSISNSKQNFNNKLFQK